MPAMKHPLSLVLVLTVSAGVALAEKSDLLSIQNTLADFLKIYLLKPEKRSSQDTVTVKELPGVGYAAEISYWRSLKSRESAEEICNAYRWILFGRGIYGKGAAAAFEQYPSLQQVYLRFVDIESGTKVGKKRAEIVPTQKVIPYLRVGVLRSSLAAKKPDWAAVKTDLDKGKCTEVGNAYLDVTWLDPNYLKQSQ